MHFCICYDFAEVSCSEQSITLVVFHEEPTKNNIPIVYAENVVELTIEFFSLTR
jgi:hypothetical protein